MLTRPEIDTERVQAFLGRIVTDLGASLSAALVYLGDRLGLYKAMADGAPLTPDELARRTGTNEIYCREWLLNQAAGGYVEYDAATQKYTLPAEHAAVLAQDDSPFFAQGGFQIIQALFKAVPTLEQNFRTGEGFKWGDHDRNLFEGTERFFRPAYQRSLICHWLPGLEGVVEKLEKGAVVADVGCGHGASTIMMAREFPRSTFIGFDNHMPSIERAREAAKTAGLSNITFETAASQSMPGETYDFIAFFDCLHDMGDPMGALARAKEMLKPDGTVMLVEPQAKEATEDNFDVVGRVFSAASVLCCTPNALATGGHALGTLAREHQLREVANRAGFTRFRKAIDDPFNRVFEIRM